MLPRSSSGRRISRFHRFQGDRYTDYGKFFAMLAAGTFLLVVFCGLAVRLQVLLQPSPLPSIKGIAGTLPDEVFIDLLGMEMANLQGDEDRVRPTSRDLGPIIFQMLTGVNPQDPRTVLAGEISGLGMDKAVLFRRGTATDAAVYPVDHVPPPEVLKPAPGWEPLQEEASSDADGSPEADPAADGEAEGPLDLPAAEADARKRVKVFIYHSHNRESWVPELEGVTKLNDAYDANINITLLGKRLAERLEEEGIGTKVSDKDYPSAVKDFNYNKSYSYSLKTVQEAAATYPELTYYFDIHRDSQRRDLTTAEIDGIAYAQVYFVIGHKNPNWKQNETFAKQIHDRLEEKYPGLSRGIYGKTAQTGNGEYNQHISPNAILIEVGGPENTLEESYRTIDVLAEVISDVIWDAEKVDAPVPAGDVVRASADQAHKYEG